jgi:CubicO group peptidase (beta-lactamase class C family)
MPNAVPLLDSARRRTNVASPHYRFGDTVRVIGNASVDAVASAGSVWASVADMARWARFVLDSARVDGRRLLKPETYAEWLKPETMFTPSEFYPTARLTKPHWTTYAFGWFQEDYSGRMVDFHTGSIDGMVAIIGLIPDERLGVYVLANVDHAEVRHALMYRVFDLYSGNPPRDWSKELLDLYAKLDAKAKAKQREAEQRRVADTHPSLPLERYAGTYTDSTFGNVVVSVQQGTLHFAFGRGRIADLTHWQYDTFQARWEDVRMDPSLIVFTPDGTGGVGGVRAFNITFVRAPGADHT